MLFVNMKIGIRLSLGFLVAAAFLLVNGVQSITSLQRVNEGLKTVYNDRVVPLKGLKVIADAYAVNVIDAVNKTNAGLMTAEDALKEVQNASQQIKKEWPAYMATTLTVEEEKLALEAEKLFEPANQSVQRLELALQKLSGMTQGQLAEFDGPLYATIDPIGGKITQLIDLQLRVAKEVNDSAAQQFEQDMVLTLGLIVAALLFFAAMGFFITRSITRPLNQAVKVAQTVAAGDLSSQIEVKSKDETGQLLQALKDMNESLSGIVGDVRGSSDSITTASKQIATGNADLSQRTEEQASSLEETASSMEELTSTVRQNAENAKQANQLAASASDVAVKGGQVVGQVVQTMSSINDSSKKIVDIISVIEGIAFQTNILALNAAVEAARAGEQGRGFAVVAGEVRNLAQRSAAAAKEIKTLIGDSVDKVDAGAKLVDQAGATMNEIVNAVKRVTDIMSEISAASTEQSAGIEQVNQAITQMDEATQQNAALVEEAAAAAESMQEQANVLMEAVSVFKLETVAGRQIRAAVTKPVHTVAAPVYQAHATPRRAVSSTAGAPVKRIPKLGKAADGTEEWKEF